MNTHRILMLILIAAVVCVISAGIGAAEDVNLIPQVAKPHSVDNV